VPAGLNRFQYKVFDDLAYLFNWMAVATPFAASEMSLSFLLMMVARGDRRLVAIPVFPSRSFRHGQVYLHTRSGIRVPADLVGKSVGVAEYHMTAALWIRAWLQHDYGVHSSDINWFVASRQEPVYSFAMPTHLNASRVADTAELESMFAKGAIDALVAASAPKAYGEGDEHVRRLFSNYRDVERAYYERTGIFPIMHTVVLRRDVYEQDRTLALSLLEAFEEAKQQAQLRLREMGTLAIMHPWLGAELAEVTETFGGDPFVYGLSPNLHVLETAARLSHEQGLSPRVVDVRELFAEETLDWTPPPSPLIGRRW
jgi:4,5-dihydroxyphthalate decarboxylase